MPIVSTLIMNALVMTGEKSLDNISTFQAGETSYHLSRFNSMLDSWSNERLMVPYLSQNSFALTVSVGSYTIGSTATFNIPRPTRLVDPCFIRDSDNNDTPLEIVSMESYGRIVQKTADGSYPIYVAYDMGYSATSSATVYFWPEPSANLTAYLNTLQPLTNFSTVSQPVQLPPGYQDAIESNYAVRSAIGVLPISNDLKEMARLTKAALKVTNMIPKTMRLDDGVVGAWRSNILSGP